MMKAATSFLVVFIFLSISLIAPLLSSSPAYAAPCDPSIDSNGEEITFLGLPAWYKYLDGDDSTGRCSPVLSGTDEGSKVNSALPIGLAVLEAMIRLAGLVAVVMIFWAGFKYITSQGNPDAAAGARKTVINALIGLVIVVLSVSLISFVGNELQESTAEVSYIKKETI